MDAESSGLHDPPARHDRTHHAHFYVVPSLGGRGFARRCRLEHRGLPRLDLFVAGNSRLEPGSAYGLRLAVAIGRDALLRSLRLSPLPTDRGGLARRHDRSISVEIPAQSGPADPARVL